MEVAIREHFAGFRSHTSLFAGFVFVVVVGVLFYASARCWRRRCRSARSRRVAFYLARRAFQRASGGLSYRIG